MDETTRARRVAELRVVQCENPKQLIDRYCRIVGEPPSSQLPPHASFSKMIDTIVDAEAATQATLKTANATT